MSPHTQSFLSPTFLTLSLHYFCRANEQDKDDVWLFCERESEFRISLCRASLVGWPRLRSSVNALKPLFLPCPIYAFKDWVRRGSEGDKHPRSCCSVGDTKKHAVILSVCLPKHLSSSRLAMRLCVAWAHQEEDVFQMCFFKHRSTRKTRSLFV